jgi:hypothetical protein
MNPKKLHEAPRLVSYIKSKSESLQVKKSIDIGSGQGYLSHLLVTQGSLKVVAIEGNEHNTHESQKRSELIQEKLGIKGEYETISRIVTKDNISEFTQEPCFLVGLHTCGDLAAVCLKLFVHDPLIRGVFNVGCCYHHLSEFVQPEAREGLEKYLQSIRESYKGRDLDETVWASAETAGFPLSFFIQNNFKGFFLGRLPRTLAISEPVKFHLKDPGLTFRKFQYRASFQVLLHKNFPHMTDVYSVGNRVKNFGSFAEYAFEAFSRLKLVHQMTAEEIQGFYDENFRKFEKKSAIFWVVRSALSGPIENLVILDRALYLIENGHQAEVLSIFDKSISPRNVVVSGFRGN